jgi:hypothetical protein
VNARWLALALSATASCGSSREAVEQQSAAQVARAIEVVREAPNAAKAAALEGLGKLVCNGAEVCAARDACVAAYREHVEAVTLTEAAKLQLVEGNGNEAAKLLGSAQQKLGAAKDKVAGCTDREAALRRRYKL